MIEQSLRVALQARIFLFLSSFTNVWIKRSICIRDVQIDSYFLKAFPLYEIFLFTRRLLFRWAQVWVSSPARPPPVVTPSVGISPGIPPTRQT